MILKLFLLCLNFYLGLAQESCQTPNGQVGLCKELPKCNPIMAIIRNRPISIENRQFLIKSRCGYDGSFPKVCCPRVGYVSTNPRILEQLSLLPKKCGNSNEPISYTIGYGGNKTRPFEFPWMALLSYNDDGKVSFQCGGTIINPRYILTAAHCITLLGKRTLVGVRVGEHDLSTEVDCAYKNENCAPKYQDLEIEEAIPHPQYVGTGRRLQNDIGLIRLSKEIDMSPGNVDAICLPITRELQLKSLENKWLIVTGWGATETSVSSPDLLKLRMPIMDNVKCGRVYNGSVKDGIGPNQVCAGGVAGVDSCGGDSGGPLQLETKFNYDELFVQFGIVSFGSKICGREGVPGVYTRVSNYMDWILDNLKP